MAEENRGTETGERQTSESGLLLSVEHLSTPRAWAAAGDEKDTGKDTSDSAADTDGTDESDSDGTDESDGDGTDGTDGDGTDGGGTDTDGTDGADSDGKDS